MMNDLPQENQPEKILHPHDDEQIEASQVKITNHKDKANTIKGSGITKGDTVKVYNASSKNK